MLSAPLTLDSVMSFSCYMQIKQQQIMQDRGINLNLSNYHIPHVPGGTYYQKLSHNLIAKIVLSGQLSW